jgi:hypothetical protein
VYAYFAEQRCIDAKRKMGEEISIHARTLKKWEAQLSANKLISPPPRFEFVEASYVSQRK